MRRTWPLCRAQLSHRLTPEAMRLLAVIAAQLGISQAAVLELLIREKARRIGVK
jgi:hypothetical protein